MRVRVRVRVRGEALRHYSSVLLNFTPPLMHKRVIKVGLGIFPENLFSTKSRIDYSTIFPTFRLCPLTSAYRSMTQSYLTLKTCFKGVRIDLTK